MEKKLMINSYAYLLSQGFNVACNNYYSCLFMLPAPRDFLGKDNLTAFLAQKFLNDDKPVQNLVRSSEWLMFLIYSFCHCLLMTDMRQRSPSSDINAMKLSQNTYCSWSIFFFTRSV